MMDSGIHIEFYPENLKGEEHLRVILVDERLWWNRN
jgi:hypothetical protein